MKSALFITALLSALTLIACGEEDRPTTAPVAQTGRGSTACHAWQSALCVFSEKCGVQPAAECQVQARAISCKSDELARSCTESLNDGTCTNPPQGCDLRDLADPAPAIAACHDFTTAVCESDNRCGRNMSVEECANQLRETYECERMVGVKLEFEGCLEELESLACSDPAPGKCTRVFLR